MACKTCMAARKRMAERMGLDRYNRLLGKRLPLDPEDERQLSTHAAGTHAAGDGVPTPDSGSAGVEG